MARPAPALAQVNLVVRDMDASLAFYRLLGLGNGVGLMSPIDATRAFWPPQRPPPDEAASPP
jgi:hypothetical protein